MRESARVGEELAEQYRENRPSQRRSTIRTTWERAQRASPDGKVRDPNNGEILEWDGKGPRKWDMGHKPGREYRKGIEDLRDGKITKEEFLKNYRNPDNYRPEAPSSNRGRRHEAP